MNILVTGGAGYIGSHVCVELINQGYKVIVLDNLCNSKIKALHGVSKIIKKKLNFDIKKNTSLTFCKVDLRQEDEIERIFSSQNIDFVMHLAGLKSVKESVLNPSNYHLNNVTGTINLLNVMKKFNCKSIIFSSSATVYGNTQIVPINENVKLSPSNPYGENKREIESILKKIFKLDNSWRIAILRFFNPIGAHKSGIIGESPNDIPNNLMPFILKVALNDFKALCIYGDDYDTHDGTGVRDYIHVLDIAYGHIKALEELIKKPQVFIVNLGTGQGYSVFDIIRSFEKVSGKQINFKIIERREGDIAISFADPSYAREKLGWTTKYDLEEMCIDSWKYVLKNNSDLDKISK